jgi:hypothetical protein
VPVRARTCKKNFIVDELVHLTFGHLMLLVIRSCAARILIFAKVEVLKPPGAYGWRGPDPCSPMRRARDCATT